MRAVVYERYGPPEVLHLIEVAKPIPAAHEVLIQVRATTVSSGDWRVRSLEVPAGFGLIIRLVFGFSRPKQPILGSELAGVVEAVGSDVSRFRPGDPLVAFSDTAMGCHAEYICLPEDGQLALKPSNLNFHEAAALCFGGTTALAILRQANVQPGERVLINGASGSVGTAALQLARHLGAEVIGVCSAANQDLVRSLGASQVIDYQQADFSQSGDSFDVIIDTAGTAPFARSRGCLRPGGRLVLVQAGLGAMLLSPWQTVSSNKTVIAGPLNVKAGDVAQLAELAEAGVYRPVIDRHYPLEQIVAAHRYVDSGRKTGNVVITLDPEG
ncbi:MAG: NAD(P)-dependent alcohol dehydrogenase [Cyanobium sp. CZS 48M]|nr:NAD(P)-dependent alcohol dehydrogenase [Cyanobium sp. CZS48M]